MNCCDDFGDCRQGRDCPARKCPHCYGIGYDASGHPCTCGFPARVAKVKQRTHGKAPLPASAWREQLRHLAKWLLIVIALALLAGLAVSLLPSNPGTNCRALIAGWHPDVPAHIQAKCREAGHA